MAWGKAGSTTLSSDGDTVDVTGLSNNNTIMILFHRITSGNSRGELTFNGDTGSNYADRYNVNGGSENVDTNRSNWNFQHYNMPNDSFWVGHFVNIASEEKLGIGLLIGEGSAGAGNAPNRGETVYKWENTSDVVSQTTFSNSGSGDYLSGTNATVLGSELTPANLNLPDGTLFVEKDTADRYWLSGSTWTIDYTNPLVFQDDFSTDKGWTTTDSGKYSYNSGGWIDFDASSDQTDNRISIDIGTTLSDTAWIMRWKQEITTFVQGTQGQHLSLDIGIADREVDGATAIGIIKAHHASNVSVNYTNVSGYAVGDGTDYDSYGGTPSYPNGHVSGFTPSAKTNWVELKRTGATTVSLAFYTDSTYSTLDGSVTEVTIGSSPTGLRYVMLGSEYANQIAGTARYTGKFSELKVWNGVTSVP